MKRNMARVFAVMLMLALIFSFAGCKKEDDPTSSTASQGQTTNPTTSQGQQTNPTVYTVTFSDGLGGAPISLEKKEGDVITLPENTFTCEGYEFAGWQLGDTLYAVGDSFTVGTENVSFVAKWRLNAPEIGQPAFSQESYDYDRVGGKDLEMPLDLQGATVYYVEIDGEIIQNSAYEYNTESGCLVVFEKFALQLVNGTHTIKVITNAADALPVICQVFVDNSIKTTFDEITTKPFVYGKDSGVTFAVDYNGATVKELTYGDVTLAPEFYEVGENSITLKDEWLRCTSGPVEYTLWLSNYDNYTFTVTSNVIFYTDYDLVTVHDELVSSSGINSMYQDSTRVEIVDGPDAMDGKVLQITPHTAGGSNVYHGYYTLRAPSLQSTWMDIGFSGNYFLVEFDYLTEGTSVGTLSYQSITTAWRQDLLLGAANDGVVHHYEAIVSKEEVGGGIYLYAFFENGGGKLYVDNFSITQLDAVPTLSAPESYQHEGDLQLTFAASGYKYVKTLIDGVEIAASYDASTGVVTIAKSALDEIASGTHTVTVVSGIGKFSAVVRITGGGTAELKDTSVNYAYGKDESVKLFGTFSQNVSLLSLKQLDKVVDSTYEGWDFASCDTETNFASLVTFVTGENDTGYIQLPASFLDKFYGDTKFVAEFSNGTAVEFTVSSDVVIFSNFDESTVNHAVYTPIHSGLQGTVEIVEREPGNKAWRITSTAGSGPYACAYTVEFDANPNIWFRVIGQEGTLYRITFTYQIVGLEQGSVYFCLAGTNEEDFLNNIFGGYDSIEPWGDVGGRIARYNLIADGQVHTFDSGWFTYNPSVRMTKIQLPEFGADANASFMVDDYRITQTTGVVNPLANLGDYNIQQTTSYSFACDKTVTSLTIDGNEIAFTQNNGVVSISIEAMNALQVGSHELRLVTADGVFCKTILAKLNTVAELTETSKVVTYGGGDVTLAGKFAGVTVTALTRRGGVDNDNAFSSPAAMSVDYITLTESGMIIASGLADQVYGTMSYEVTLSDGTVLAFTLTSNNALYNNYDETKIYCETTESWNIGICQDTYMISVVDVNGNYVLKYSPENAVQGHAANGGYHNGAFTFSVQGLHAGWTEIVTPMDSSVTLSFDYSIVLGDKSVSGYSVYYATKSGGEVVVLLDPTKTNFTMTFAPGELACFKLFCPATGECSYENIQGTYMLFDNLRVTTGIVDPIANLGDFDIQQTTSYSFACEKPVTSLTIDGNEIAFTQNNGVVSISIEAMNALQVGSHELRLVTADGVFCKTILAKLNTVAELTETSKVVTYGGGDVTLAGKFAGVTVTALTRRGGMDNDSAVSAPVAMNVNYITLMESGMIIASGLADQVYGTMSYEVTLSDGTVLAFTLTSNNALYNNYDETKIYCETTESWNIGICQDTYMISVVDVNGNCMLKYSPENAVQGHAANGGYHNGAFTFSVKGMHVGWSEIVIPVDSPVTLTFDYSIVLGDKSVSGYAVYYVTKSGGEIVELLDPNQTTFTKTFAAGELACFKLFCPATGECSYENIQGTYMLFDNLRVTIDSNGSALFESSKNVSWQGGDVKIAGDFSEAGLSVISVTRQCVNYYDNGDTEGHYLSKTVNSAYVTLAADGLIISKDLISQIYGTQNIVITLSNGKVITVTLTSDTVLFTNYEETTLFDTVPNHNEGICQDTGMLSFVEVDGDNMVKYSPENATLGHAANGGVHNGAFTFSVTGLHAGWMEIALPADRTVTLSFDYSIFLGDKSVSGYAVCYGTKTGGETVVLLDPNETTFTMTFAAGELAYFKLFCPATEACSFADIQGTYMLFDDLRVVIN